MKLRQKSFTCSGYFTTLEQITDTALRLFKQFGPNLEPVRKVGISLLNMKDEFGNRSDSGNLVLAK